MKPVDYPQPFGDLTRELRRLPGIGPRTAERIALWLASSKDARPLELARALRAAAENLRACTICGFFATQERCQDLSGRKPRRPGRSASSSRPLTFSRLNERASFKGRYHVLGGRLAPLDHIGPEQLRIGALLARVKNEAVSEIILALSADVEGEATTNYLAEVLAPLGVPITRIAHGLPAGGGLEHADPLTLQRALAGRNLLKI